MKSVFYPTLILLLLSGCVKKLSVEETSTTISKDRFHNRTTGASARELLSDEKFQSLTLEVQYMKGYKPEIATIDNVTKFLDTYLRKPGGIHIVYSEIDSVDSNALSMEDAWRIEKRNRTVYSEGKNIAVYLLFTNGIHTGNKILGMAYRNTSAVIYGKAIHDNSSSTTTLTRVELETAVTLHELGHLLGLTIGEASKGHMDAHHANHCDNKNCLMYYATETRHVFKDFLKGNIPSLDANCIDDLIANGGKPLQSKF